MGTAFFISCRRREIMFPIAISLPISGKIFHTTRNVSPTSFDLERTNRVSLEVPELAQRSQQGEIEESS
jgi:hypothetical protein